jgi:hypothetical protein
MEQEPGTSMRRMAVIKSLKDSYVHELPYPYHLLRFKALTSTIPEKLHSADGFFTNMQFIHFYLVFCTLMKQDFHEMALPQYLKILRAFLQYDNNTNFC